ncbi:hypothetical protein [Buchnera aphidicola]|uniref:hypothetical protein n=1 Tax=Buchnera aphidicola TaxID=9 RepID=UPI001651AA37|nr:hypothetical protein [Buchnera aphidicola]
MIFDCSYKWIILAFLFINFQDKSQKNIDNKIINTAIFTEKIKNYHTKNNFFLINLKII